MDIKTKCIKKYLNGETHNIRNLHHLKNNENNSYNAQSTHCQICHKKEKIWYLGLLIHYDKNGWQIYDESNHVFMGNWNMDECFVIKQWYSCEQCIHKYLPQSQISSEEYKKNIDTQDKYKTSIDKFVYGNISDIICSYIINIYDM